MAIFVVYCYTDDTKRTFTEEIHTTSEFTAQMVCAELVAKGKDAWVEQVQ